MKTYLKGAIVGIIVWIALYFGGWLVTFLSPKLGVYMLVISIFPGAKIAGSSMMWSSYFLSILIYLIIGALAGVVVNKFNSSRKQKTGNFRKTRK